MSGAAEGHARAAAPPVPSNDRSTTPPATRRSLRLDSSWCKEWFLAVWHNGPFCENREEISRRERGVVAGHSPASAGSGPPTMARDTQADAPDAARELPPGTDVMVSRLGKMPSSFRRRNAPRWNSDARKAAAAQAKSQARASFTRLAPVRRCSMLRGAEVPDHPALGCRGIYAGRVLSVDSVEPLTICVGAACPSRACTENLCMSSLSVQLASALGTPRDARADGDAMESHVRDRSARFMYVYLKGRTRPVGRIECGREQVRLLSPPGPAHDAAPNNRRERRWPSACSSQLAQS